MTSALTEETSFPVTSIIDLGRQVPSRRFFLAGFVVAIGLHVYAAGLLSAVLDISLDEWGDVRDANLENDEIGNDPDLPTNYNIDRIEEISVPGPVNPLEAVGILNAVELPPQTLPPPPGFLHTEKQNGGIEPPGFPDLPTGTPMSLELPSGTGADGGEAGGLEPVTVIYALSGGQGGPRIVSGAFAGASGATREKMIRESGSNPPLERTTPVNTTTAVAAPVAVAQPVVLITISPCCRRTLRR
jgi:hypothetical protein